MPAYKDTKTGKWYCKFYYETADGDRKQKLKRGFDLKRQADEWERDFLKLHNHENTILIKDLFNVYMAHVEKELAVSTAVSYRQRLGLLVDQIGDRTATSITSEDIEQILPTLGSYSTNSKTSILRVWNAFFTFGVKRYKLKNNPVSLINKPTERTTDNNFWTFEQFQRFKEHAQPCLYLTACEIIYYTGLRVGELLALTVGSVDIENNKLKITATRDYLGTRAPKTKTSRRVVYLAPYVTGLLADQISIQYSQDPETLLFPTTQQAIRRFIKNTAERAGLPDITVHGLRHSHASLLANNNASLHDISDRLGHSSPVITAGIYTHLFDDRRQALANDLQKIIDNSKNQN